jgi:putative ABC transport system ATP-binding protein
MSTRKSKPIIEVKNLYKSFKIGKGEVPVLKGINLEVEPGEFVIIFGPSGCGKSTLLNTIVGLEKPTTGEVLVMGEKFYDKKPDERATIRRRKFGIIHQQPSWVKSLNVLENVAFPLCIEGQAERKALRRASIILNLFRLEEFEKNLPTELSGGQQQRVTVTRALISEPLILIADEPTGNLDTVSAADLMYALQFLNTESKRTIIMVTHNPEYESYAHKVVKMEDGRIREIKVNKKVEPFDYDHIPKVIPEGEVAQ